MTADPGPEYDGPDRTPNPVPSAPAAERSVLGAMMYDPRVIDDVVEVVSAEDFYDTRHEVLFGLITGLQDRNQKPDPVTVWSEVNRRDLARQAGGDATYLHDLFRAPYNSGSAGHYARDVRSAAIRRRLAEVGRRTESYALTPSIDPDDAKERAEIELAKVDVANGADTSVRFGDELWGMLDELDKPVPDTVGVPTGFPDLDEPLGQMRNGQLIIVGARPRVGKSVLLGDLARHAAIDRGVPSLFVSLEMSRRELANRWLAGSARVDLSHIINHTLTEREWDLVGKHHQKLLDAPLHIDASGGMNLAGLRARVRSHVRRYGVRIVFIDYLQLLTMPAGKDRREQVDAGVRGLKLLAQALDLPIVVAAQLNRTADHAAPSLGDFRESGEIENSADVAILLDRPELREAARDPKADPVRPGELDAIIAKNRNGPTCTVTLAFEGHYTRCSSLARGGWSPSRHATDSTTDITEPARHREAG